MKDSYLETLDRMEPDIEMVDPAGSGASIAISLKRIADALQYLVLCEQQKQQLTEALAKSTFETGSRPGDKGQDFPIGG